MSFTDEEVMQGMMRAIILDAFTAGARAGYSRRGGGTASKMSTTDVMRLWEDLAFHQWHPDNPGPRLKFQTAPLPQLYSVVVTVRGASMLVYQVGDVASAKKAGNPDFGGFSTIPRLHWMVLQSVNDGGWAIADDVARRFSRESDVLEYCDVLKVLDQLTAWGLLEAEEDPEVYVQHTVPGNVEVL